MIHYVQAFKQKNKKAKRKTYMTEQHPAPTPAEAPIPVPHREKSEQEVADQVGRITDKLLSTASELNLTGAIDRTNTPNDVINVDYSPDTALPYMNHHKTVKGIGQDNITSNKYLSRKEEGAGIDKKVGNKIIQIDTSDTKANKNRPLIGQIEHKSDAGVITGYSTLDQGQTVHAAAGILSETRGDLANRKIQGKAIVAEEVAEQRAKTDQDINEILIAK
ncbi:MAG: hypothetical protein ACXWLH_01590 [Candidatus Saccharimonadales bacterium]